jgi:hypothetical protein
VVVVVVVVAAAAAVPVEPSNPFCVFRTVYPPPSLCSLLSLSVCLSLFLPCSQKGVFFQGCSFLLLLLSVFLRVCDFGFPFLVFCFFFFIFTQNCSVFVLFLSAIFIGKYR